MNLMKARNTKSARGWLIANRQIQIVIVRATVNKIQISNTK